MATTSSFAHVNDKIQLFSFVPELTKGTPNWQFQAKAGGSTTSTIIDTAAGAGRDDLNLASMTTDFLNGLQIYISTGTDAGEVVDITASAESGGDVTLTHSALTTGTSASDVFYVLGPITASNISANPETEDLERDFARLTLDAPSGVKGLSKMSGSFEMEMCGLVTTLGNGATPTYDRLSQFLTCVGTRRAAAGTDITGSGSTTTTLDVSVSAGFQEHDLILVENQIRRVTSVVSGSPDQLVLDYALSAAPATSAEVYQCEQFTPDDTDHRTHSFIWLIDDRLIELRECVCSVKVGGEFGGKVMMPVEFDGMWDPSWGLSDAATLSGYQMDQDPIAFIATGGIYFNTTDLNCNSFEFDLGHSRGELRDTGGNITFNVNGRVASCKVVMRDIDKTPKATWENAGTKARMTMSAGNTAGDACAFEGWAQVREPIGSSPVNDTRYWDCTFRFFDDQDAASAIKPRICRF